MHLITSIGKGSVGLDSFQDNTLLDIIKELCSEDKLSYKLKMQVSRIIADCDLTHHTSLHELSTDDDSTSTLLVFMRQTAAVLSFHDQEELNQSIVKKIQIKILTLYTELENLEQLSNSNMTLEEIVQEDIDNKLITTKEQKNEKAAQVARFRKYFTEDLNLTERIVKLMTKIAHLEIMENKFMLAYLSITVYSKIQGDLKDIMEEMEQQIRNSNYIIDRDQNSED